MSYDDSLVVAYLRHTHDTPLLTEREKHLVGLAVTMTRGCQVCTRKPDREGGGRSALATTCSMPW